MSPPFQVLVFSRTMAYRHESIPAGVQALRRLASSSTVGSHPFAVEASEDPSLFSQESLPRYRVIVLLQCSGDFLDESQLGALKGFVRSGGGVVAVHCASFAMQSSEWYGRLIGGVFDDHPEPQHGRIKVLEPGHSIMQAACPSKMNRGVEALRQGQEKVERTWLDEWYNFKEHPRATSDELKVLLAVDERTYKGGKHGDDHPVAWCQEFDGGRCFYTSLGHFDEAYEDEWFMGQLYGGILWAARLA